MKLPQIFMLIFCVVLALVLGFNVLTASQTPDPTEPQPTVPSDPTEPSDPSDPSDPTDPTEPEKTKIIYLPLSQRYEYSEGSIKLSRTEYIYDENQILTAIVNYNGEQEVSRYSIMCDRNGNIVSMNGQDSTNAVQVTYMRNDLGLPVTAITSLDDVLYSTVNRTYDESGKLLTVTSQLSDHKTSTTYHYNNTGIRVGYSNYTDDVLTASTAYVLNSQGKIISITTKDAEDTVIGTVKLTYKKNTVTHKYYDADGTLYMTLVVTYDEAGNIIQQKQSGSGVTDMVATFTYLAVEVSVNSVRQTNN